MSNLINKLLGRFVYDTCSCGGRKLKSSTECNDCFRASVIASLPPPPPRNGTIELVEPDYTRQYPEQYYSSGYVTTYSSVDFPTTTFQALYSSTADYWPTQQPQTEIIHGSTHSPDTIEPIPEGRKIII